MNDIINHPKHYKLFPDMEAIEVIEAVLTPEEFAGYLKGNALKYRLRAGDKGPEEICIGKARWYQDRLVEHFDSWMPGWDAVEPAVVANVEAFNGDWPNESRRTVEDWDAGEARMDVIGQNGPTAEHYQEPKPCEYPGADGVLYPCEHCTGREHPGCAVQWNA